MTCRDIPDGVPCEHPGCLQHVSHPCEGCGRIAGKRIKPLTCWDIIIAELKRLGADGVFKIKNNNTICFCKIDNLVNASVCTYGHPNYCTPAKLVNGKWEAVKDKKEYCEWKLDSDLDSEYYETSCDGAYCLLEGTLQDNEYKYCPNCGKEIREVK